MRNWGKSRVRSSLRGALHGQSTTEFALMFPVFVAVFIGLASVSLLFYSYVTAQLAVREGLSSLVRDPSQTIYAIRTITCNNAFSFDRSQLSVIVDPSPKSATAVPCSSLDASEPSYSYTFKSLVTVSAIYTVPLPRLSMPTSSKGSNTVILGPIQIQASSAMTIQ